MQLFCCLVLMTSFVTSHLRNQDIRQFLSHSRSLLSGLNNINFIIGNEAADADSIVSSLCYAYFRWKQSDQKFNYIPLVCVKRKDFHLRRDVSLLLEMVGVSNINELISVEETCLSELLNEPAPCTFNNELSITLVDHNVIAQPLSRWALNIMEIIDHHTDVGQYPWIENSNRIIAFDNLNKIPTAGSTCTLITEKYMQAASEDILDSNLATLLLGVILLDTGNMDPILGKGTPRDAEAIKFLISKFPSIDGQALFNILKDAKNDKTFWQSLSAEDALCLDYKSFQVQSSQTQSIGMSSVLLSNEDMFSKFDLLQTIITTYLTKEQQIFAIMSFCASPTPMRELIICSKNDDTLRNLEVHLLSMCPELGLVEISRLDMTTADGEVVKFISYQQSNIKLSRKQVAPILIEYFQRC